MSISDNVKTVLERAAQAAAASGRRPEDVTVLAASKMNDASRVREAFAAGIRFFGENRVQELEEKRTLGAYEGAALHFIGHLQTNKVKYIAGNVDLIESVDSRELVSLIGGRAAAAGKLQPILLEVNIGGEEAKSGVAPERLDELAAFASETKGIAVEGLMTIPPASDDPELSRRYFDSMAKLYVDMGAKKYDNVCMKILSMGMSADYAEAIAAGANLVRVGTAIFGRRNYAV